MYTKYPNLKESDFLQIFEGDFWDGIQKIKDKYGEASTMQFQKQIFPDKITFDGEKFGTKELSLIYKMNQQTGTDKSYLVTLRGSEYTDRSHINRCYDFARPRLAPSRSGFRFF